MLTQSSVQAAANLLANVMYCKNCGHEVEHGKKFCKNCGTAVSQVAHHVAHEVSATTHKVEHSIKSHKALWVGGGVVAGVVIVVAALAFFLSGSSANENGSGLSLSNEAAVVDIYCDNGDGGSGTIFTSNGTVLTNNHVIAGATSCKITIPDPSTGQINEIYEAAPVITPKLSKEYDVATLKIDGAYTDSNGKTWGAYPTTFTPFASPGTCDTTQPSKLGDSIRIYGYPVTSGGYNLTVTDGIISSFSDSGYILTSAKVDSGNSGGLAVDQNGCWLGIPSAVESGNYQNLGVIIPGSIVAANFLSSVPVKASPPGLKSPESATAADMAATPSDDQICQNTFGAYSESSGQYDSNGKPTCQCQPGYSWDFSGNECASDTSLQLQCQNNYGTNSYSYVQSGQSYCGCSTGYEWNSGQTACVAIPTESGYQVCAAMNATWDGTSYTSSGGYSCTCDSGYTSSADGSTCVLAPTETGYQVCSALGANETWDGTYTSDGKFNCVCESGYSWDSSSQSCISGYTYCQNTEGYGATYDSASNSCACESGYIYNGSQCESGSLYCSNRWGVGAEYDYTTGGCTCSYGYYSNGSQCVYSGY